MAESQSSRGASAVNPADILNLTSAGLRVAPRADLGGVELRVMERGEPVVAVIVAPIQAIELADKLVRAAFDSIDPDGADQ